MKILNPKPEMVLQAARECHGILSGAQLTHIIIGGLAVYLHGVVGDKPRDVDLLICRDDANTIDQLLRSARYQWDGFRKAYLNPNNGVRVDVHWDGKMTRKGVMQLPHPKDVEVDEHHSLPVMAMGPLLETKLNRILHGDDPKSKHRKHVLSLIRLRDLNESFSENLGKEIRGLYQELLRESSGPGVPGAR